MARTTIKGTYSLDVDTVRALEDLARRWSVPKSEVLRRVIAEAARTAFEDTEALQALDQLQASVRLDTESAEDWVRAVRRERRASARRREKDR